MRSLALAAIFAVACSPARTETKPVETPATSASAPAAAPASGGLVIKESTFSGGTPPATITLRADGRIEGPDGKTKATLTTDGQLIGASSGKVVASIDPNGKVKFSDGNEATIDEDGTIHMGADTVKLGADGTIEGDKSGTKIVVSDPAGRRAAMFVVLVLTMPKPAPAPK